MESSRWRLVYFEMSKCPNSNHERIAIQGAKKGGRLALPLERLRYQVLNVV